MNIGEIIAELRIDRNMNQEDLAAILNISRSALANWESGNRRIDIETVVIIADFFGVSCDYLLGRTKHKYNFALENEKKCRCYYEYLWNFKDIQNRKRMKCILEIIRYAFLIYLKAN